MSTNASGSTAHFGLSQWAENDRILREDFNHDNAAIEAALLAQQQSTAAQIQSALGQICVQKLGGQSLSGDTGSITLDLSGVDLSQYERLELSFHNLSGTASAELLVRCNGDSTSGHYAYYSAPSLNDYTGLRIGWVSSDYRTAGLLRLWEHDGKVAGKFHSGRGDGQSNFTQTQDNWCFWRQGGLSAVQSLTVCCASGSLKSGSCVTLYGWKK